ncbi:hypothetical protein [Pinirhizobacter sp.]|jgi:hypothetical protein|uniref:hypothetical protein n=1 Tax=Pinirhizobacter sp. TaxID=2950432 RepID=UPI002F4090FF
MKLLSIGEIASSIPRAAVIGLAALSGVSNVAAAPVPFRHDGGLQTKLNALWEDNGAIRMRACLSSHTARSFEPARLVIDCLLQTAATWKDDSDDPYAATVVSRGVHRYGLDKPYSVASSEEAPPRAPLQALHAAVVTVRKSDEYLHEMARLEARFSLYTTTRHSDASNSRQPFTTDSLKQRLEGTSRLRSFKEEAYVSSSKINTMMTRECKNIFVLKPELMPSRSDPTEFQKEVDRYYVAAPDAELDERQFDKILARLASFMNKRHSLG